MRCPDDGRELAGDDAQSVCRVCQGVLMSSAELTEWSAEASAQLAIETNEKSGAFARTRSCPQCSAPMAPWRIGKLQAWLERCPSCEVYWLEKQDVRTVQML